VSLALFRERIEAGEVDDTVRAHLRGCDECRAHYDLLANTRQALGDDGAREERERLFKNLPLPRRGEGRGEGAVRARWIGAAAALLLAVIGLLVFRNTQPNEVQLRGGEEPKNPAPFSLRVYGKDAPGQKVHLIADFPGSKEATVRPSAELQLFVKPPPKPGETLLVEARGALKTQALRSQPGGSDDVAAVGGAFPVGSFGPGTIEVCAVLTSSTTASLSDAVNAGATKHCSALLVSP
jgi:hypothetical protein